MNPWEQPRTVDLLDRFISDDSDLDQALALIPSLFGVSDKATYLGYRSLGFNSAEALQIMGLDEEELHIWESESPEFLQFESEHLYRLQSEVNTELIRLGFLRNMAMFVAKDASLIRKSLLNFDNMSKREYDYMMSVRKHYTPNDLYNLDKALNPTKHQDNVIINLEWGQHQAIEGVQTPYKVIGESDGNNDRVARIPLSSPEEQGTD